MRKKIATIIATLGLLLTAAVPAGVAASTPDRAAADLSSLPAIEAYLLSIGVDPGSVVVQEGPLNYAGPSCPGADWNCTSATRVVQISTARSGANIFDCLPALDATFPALNECLIVQSSVLSVLDPPPTNDATCTPTFSSDGTTKSKCTIRQSSKKGNNNASVSASIKQSGGSSQSAKQDATITQVSDSGNNTAKIAMTIQQSMSLDGNDDPNQTQNALQTAKVDQTSGSGNNSSDVRQTEGQTEAATSSGNITQNQNTDTTLGRNQQATITQTSTSGHNTSNLQHQITQRQNADCASCTVNQTQGSGFGGQSGTVTQTTGPVTMTTVAALNEEQQQDADTSGTWIRTQFDPQDCCGQQNGGTAANVNTVSLGASQRNMGGFTHAVQSATCSETVVDAQCSTSVTATQNGTTSPPNSCPPPSTGSCSSFQSCNGGICGGDPPALPGASQQGFPLATSMSGAPLSRVLSPEAIRSRVT